MADTIPINGILLAGTLKVITTTVEATTILPTTAIKLPLQKFELSNLTYHDYNQYKR